MKTDITPSDSVCPIFLEPADPAQIAADQAQAEAQAEAQAQAKADAATAKQVVLTKLGLTADEVTALLG